MPTTLVPARVVMDSLGVCGVPANPQQWGYFFAYTHLRWLRGNHVVTPTYDPAKLAGINTGLAANNVRAPRVKAQHLVMAYLNNTAVTAATNRDLLLRFRADGLLDAIEGPNEIQNPYVGNGSHGPADTRNRCDPAYGGGGDGTFAANTLEWARWMRDLRAGNASLAGVPLIAPSWAVAPGGAAKAGAFYFQDYPDLSTTLTGAGDAGCIHFYAGGGHQPNLGYTPPSIGNQNGNFHNTQLQIANAVKLPLAMSEFGAATDGVSYARDGNSQAKYLLNQFFDFLAVGGKRAFIYNFMDGDSASPDPEQNYGIWFSDGRPKPAAVAVRNLMALLALGRDYEDARNDADTAAFSYGYDGAGLSISGLTDASVSGSYLVMPKSDGSAMVAVWHEPEPLDSGGVSRAIPANAVTVALGVSRGWRVYDPTGTAGGTQAATATTAPIASGNGAGVPLTLRGHPMLIEVDPPAGYASTTTPPPPAPAPAPSGTLSGVPATATVGQTLSVGYTLSGVSSGFLTFVDDNAQIGPRVAVSGASGTAAVTVPDGVGNRWVQLLGPDGALLKQSGLIAVSAASAGTTPPAPSGAGGSTGTGGSTGAAVPLPTGVSFLSDWTADPVRGGWGSVEKIAADRMAVDTSLSAPGGKPAVRCAVMQGDDLWGTGGEYTQVAAMLDAAGAPIVEAEGTAPVYVAFAVRLPAGWGGVAVDADGSWSILIELHGTNQLRSPPCWRVEAGAPAAGQAPVFQCGGRTGAIETNPVGDHPWTRNNAVRPGVWTMFVAKFVFSKTDGEMRLYRRDADQTAWDEVVARAGVPTLQYSTRDQPAAYGLPALPAGQTGDTYWKQGLYRGPAPIARTDVHHFSGATARAGSFAAAATAAFGAAMASPDPTASGGTAGGGTTAAPNAAAKRRLYRLNNRVVFDPAAGRGVATN